MFKSPGQGDLLYIFTFHLTVPNILTSAVTRFCISIVDLACELHPSLVREMSPMFVLTSQTAYSQVQHKIFVIHIP